MPKRRAKSAGAKPKIKKIEYPKWYFEKENINKDFNVQQILRDNRLVRKEEKLEEIFESNNFIKKNNNHRYILNLLTIKEKRSKLKSAIKSKNDVDDMISGMQAQSQIPIAAKPVELPIIDSPKQEEVKPEPYQGIPCQRMFRDNYDEQSPQIDIETLKIFQQIYKKPNKASKEQVDVMEMPLKKPDAESSRVLMMSQIKKLEQNADFVVAIKKHLKVKFHEPSKKEETKKEEIKKSDPPIKQEVVKPKPEPLRQMLKSEPPKIISKEKEHLKSISPPKTAKETVKDMIKSEIQLVKKQPEKVIEKPAPKLLEKIPEIQKHIKTDIPISLIQIEIPKISSEIKISLQESPKEIKQPSPAPETFDIRSEHISSQQVSLHMEIHNAKNFPSSSEKIPLPDEEINNDSSLIPPKQASPDKKFMPNCITKPQSQTVTVKKQPAIRQYRSLLKSGSKRETYASIEQKKVPQKKFHKHDKWWGNQDCWFSYCQMHSWKQNEEERQSKLYFLSDQESQAEYEFFKNLQRQKYLEVRMQRPRSNYSVNYLELQNTATDDHWNSRKRINLSLNDSDGLQMSKTMLKIDTMPQRNRPQSQFAERQKQSEQKHIDRNQKTVKSVKNQRNERFKTMYKQYFIRY